MELFVSLIGGVALLLWGIRMVRTAITRGFGAELRRVIAASAGRRVAALGAGIGVTALLQSSTATSLLVVSFAMRGAITGGLALAVLLGADVGTTLVVQLFSQRVTWLSPLFVLAGVIGFMVSERTKPRNLGRAGIGFGLILLALELIAKAAQPMAGSEAVQLVLAQLGSEPMLAILVVGALTLLLHSSVVVVLLLATLAGAGVLTLKDAFFLVLGANLGSAFLPVMATSSMPLSVRIEPIANALVRSSGVVIFAFLVTSLTPMFAETGFAAATLVALFHMVFNVAIALAALPFVDRIAAVTRRLFAGKVVADHVTAPPSDLEETAFETPAVALACATREALKVGDIIQDMLRQTMEVFRLDDPERRKYVENLDDTVDRQYEAIKLYLARLTRGELDETESDRSIEILSFTTNLEHIGDIIDKNLMELAAKKAKNKVTFSEDGLEEIERFHADVLANMSLALNVFVTGDLNLARQLLEQKASIR